MEHGYKGLARETPWERAKNPHVDVIRNLLR